MPISEEQKMIINPILHIGPLIIERNVAYNSFLIQLKPFNILVDIPPIQVVKIFKTEIEQYIEIKKITHIIISQITASTLDTLKELLVDGFRGVILTNQYFAKQLSSISKIVKFQMIDTINCELVLNDQLIFKFIPMNFLPFPEMFMTYMPMNQALFSSSLFSSYYDGILLPSLNHIKNSIFSFHKSNMPNSMFLQKPLRIIYDLNIKTIYPTMGYIISNQIIENIMEFEIQLDFYNNYQVFFYDEAGEKCINYREIINHMINHLQKSYAKIEILNAFVGTSMSLQPDPLMLNKTTLDGYKLWHSFFENIYVKKGLSWITILEPLVNRYYNDYNIPKPNVYLSKFIEMSMKADSLKQSNDELVQHIEELNNEIENTLDRFMRCPITKLYNQDFFQQLLKNDLDKGRTEGKTRGFILVQLDQLTDINRRYGKETGDETIRNMAYEIQQTIRPDSLVFKQNGPGILVYQESTIPKNIETSALNFRNKIADSNLFIEPVSVSISTVDLDEIDSDLDDDQKIREIFILLNRRISLAVKKGTGSIVSSSAVTAKNVEGSVLIIDKDEVNLNMLNRIFKRINFDVKLAHSVVEAIEIVDHHKIDVIISEINISKIDGFTLKQMLNESKDHAKIPFIMVSHNKTLENIKRCNTLNVNLMLEKPIIPDELIGHVKRFQAWVNQQ